MGRPQKILKGPRKAPKGPQKVVEAKLQKEWSAQKWQAGKSLFWERPEAVDKVGDGFGQKTSREKLNNFDNFFFLSLHILLLVLSERNHLVGLDLKIVYKSCFWAVIKFWTDLLNGADVADMALRDIQVIMMATTITYDNQRHWI